MNRESYLYWVSITLSILLLVVMCLGWYFFLPDLVSKQVAQEFISQENKLGTGLVDRLHQAEKEIESSFQTMALYKSQTEQNAKRAARLLELTQQGSGLMHVQTGLVSLDMKVIPSIYKPNGCIADRGFISKEILFEEPFSMPPAVLLSFSKLDFGDGADHRLRIEVESITEYGFELTFATWCDTSMSEAETTWIAVGR